MHLEKKTVEAMIRIYCRTNHKAGVNLCVACAELLEYAFERIEKCPFGIDKPACNQCTVHCYKPEMRKQIRQIMRFSGPRMLFFHPILAVRHVLRSYQSEFTAKQGAPSGPNEL